jgi:hypothetical protein
LENHVEGIILSGNIDSEAHEFVVTKVKNVSTQSVISLDQLQSIYRYLLHKGERGEPTMVTINDQIPVMLNAEENQQLLHELERIQHLINK